MDGDTKRSNQIPGAARLSAAHVCYNEGRTIEGSPSVSRRLSECRNQVCFCSTERPARLSFKVIATSVRSRLNTRTFALCTDRRAVSKNYRARLGGARNPRRRFPPVRRPSLQRALRDVYEKFLNELRFLQGAIVTVISVRFMRARRGKRVKFVS